MKSKRGLSLVLKIILIVIIIAIIVIALFIAFFAITWASVKPNISDAGNQISEQSACLKVQLEPLNCTSNGQVKVKLVSAGDTKIIGLMSIMKDDKGDINVGSINWSQSDKVGDIKTIKTGLSKSVSASVAAKISVDGEIITCQQSNTISC